MLPYGGAVLHTPKRWLATGGAAATGSGGGASGSGGSAKASAAVPNELSFRTHLCGRVTTEMVGQSVVVSGWLQHVRCIGQCSRTRIRRRDLIGSISTD